MAAHKAVCARVLTCGMMMHALNGTAAQIKARVLIRLG
jgi:hypothetical protein